MTPDTPRPGTPAPHAPRQGKPVRPPLARPRHPLGCRALRSHRRADRLDHLSILSHVHIIISWHLSATTAGSGDRAGTAVVQARDGAVRPAPCNRPVRLEQDRDGMTVDRPRPRPMVSADDQVVRQHPQTVSVNVRAPRRPAFPAGDRDLRLALLGASDPSGGDHHRSAQARPRPHPLHRTAAPMTRPSGLHQWKRQAIGRGPGLSPPGYRRRIALRQPRRT
jgi:hypothetical protein